jgi:hypothetical protein
MIMTTVLDSRCDWQVAPVQEAINFYAFQYLQGRAAVIKYILDSFNAVSNLLLCITNNVTSGANIFSQ